MLNLNEILEKSLWVGKLTGGRRTVGTYKKVKAFLDMEPEKFDDFDLCARQPEELKDFYDKYFEYDLKHGFITVQDYYNKFYVKEVN